MSLDRSNKMKRLWEAKETKKKERIVRGRDLVDIVFSWSLLDVLNSNLYKGQVNNIPDTFSSTTQYLESFIDPIIEETHASLLSSMETLRKAKAFKFLDIKPSKDFEAPNKLYYDVTLQLVSSDDGCLNNKLEYNDLIAVTDKKPIRIDDLRCSNEPLLLALVCGVDEDNPHLITIMASKPMTLEYEDHNNNTQRTKRGKSVVAKTSPNVFGVYLINMMTNIRIWTALHPDPDEGNLQLISTVLQSNNEGCVACQESSESVMSDDLHRALHQFKLNSSQEDAIFRCLEATSCYNCNNIKLIWGPPGTGKTKTTSVLLLNLLKVRYRTLTCAPTNIAVLEVCSRLVALASPSLLFKGYGLGDIVLFGNKERMKIEEREDLFDVFLDYRVDELYGCLMAETGWRANANRMISLLSDPKRVYNEYTNVTRPSYKDFVQERFSVLRKDVRDQFQTLYIHLPTSMLSYHVAEKMNQAIDLLGDISISDIIANGNTNTYRRRRRRRKSVGEDPLNSNTRKEECLKMLGWICESIDLPDFIGKIDLKRLCLANAYLIFCTASGAAKLHLSSPIPLVVVDEAAQLKECESAIPLQLPGVQHAVLIGDEKQLPAMIQSEVASRAGLGRSLFERLVLLGHEKQLLNVQYRMHPSISIFPNREFYGMKILDAPSVKSRSHERRFLNGNMYGPYSFINVRCGNEQFGVGYSLKNVVEVSVAAEIVSKLYSVSRKTGRSISVGVISPYKAQVVAIQEKIGERYNTEEGFSVSVRSVDGFQGGEEDIIIISTVRSNGRGAIGFLSNQQRTNVALTRARYCLWILGNEATLTTNKSVWRQLIYDAKARNCFHDAEEDKSLAQCMERSTIALDDLVKLQNKKLITFENSIWKVSLSNEFLKSLEVIVDSEINKRVMSVAEKLSNGELQDDSETDSDNLFRQEKISNDLSLIWTVDIIKKKKHHEQVLKMWHVLPSSDLSPAEVCLEKYYERYTDVKIERCRFVRSQGDLVVPMKWPANSSAKHGIISDVSSSFAMLSVVEEEVTVDPKPVKKQVKLRRIRRKVQFKAPTPSKDL